MGYHNGRKKWGKAAIKPHPRNCYNWWFRTSRKNNARNNARLKEILKVPVITKEK